jgi:1-deoxy-D-xylulose-5-phosphate synthase
MAKRFEESFKLITPGILFEEMGIEYIGPVDGHDIESLIETMEVAKSLKKPVIIHAQTTKGKGYKFAEGTKEHWHGVGAFDLETGETPKKSGAKAATAIFSETLLEMADEDEKIVGVTAAMPSGTGMSAVMENTLNVSGMWRSRNSMPSPPWARWQKRGSSLSVPSTLPFCKEGMTR